ncbi:hypothetical protein [Burkholderia ubonensis]|uniref:hypothetical protein n=1 Tax=Burkholderia ubonensis TaxID=101571 RepID=UPI0022B76992|nr:hypothetical protein [Burkholderia ubonensis]
MLQTVLRPQAALDESGEQASEVASARDAFLLLLAYANGLRRAELAAATTGALTRTALDGALDDAWSPRVMGKSRRAHGTNATPADQCAAHARRAAHPRDGAASRRSRRWASSGSTITTTWCSAPGRTWGQKGSASASRSARATCTRYRSTTGCSLR